jgi:hypothetical protein
LWAKEFNVKGIHKEMFSLYGRKCLSRKAVHNWVEKFSQGRSKSQMMPDQTRNWLRQQSKDFYAALIKRWDKCISVGGGYVEK